MTRINRERGFGYSVGIYEHFSPLAGTRLQPGGHGGGYHNRESNLEELRHLEGLDSIEPVEGVSCPFC